MIRHHTLATVTLIGCLLVTSSPLRAQQQSIVRVVRNGAAIWRADVAVIATTVQAGTTLQVTAQSQQWYEVVIPEALGGHGERGMIARSQVQLLPGSPEPPARTLRGDPALPPGAVPGTPAGSPSGRQPRFKAFLGVNGIYQATSNNFMDGATFQANAEGGRFDTNYSVKAGPAFDVSGGATISKAFGIGVGVSRFSRATPAHFSGSVPHPFFFGQSRAVASDVSGLKREELAVHLQARAVVPAGERMRVSVFAGPSFFRVKQDAVVDFTYADSYPYDQASFKSATTTTEKASKLGFNAGADVAFFFTRQIGLGFTAQLSKATVPIKSAGSGNRDVKAGGLQTGGGLRLRF
jgi:hypothetical protein